MPKKLKMLLLLTILSGLIGCTTLVPVNFEDGRTGQIYVNEIETTAPCLISADKEICIRYNRNGREHRYHFASRVYHFELSWISVWDPIVLP